MTRNARTYTQLSDAADMTGDKRYRGGSVGIWYARTPVRVDLSVSLAVARKLGHDITRKTISVTHEHLGNIEAEDAEMAFALMRGDYWSPRGEANDWLASLGLDHTSMIVGDVVDFRGKLLFVEFEGFSEIGDGEPMMTLSMSAKTRTGNDNAWLDDSLVHTKHWDGKWDQTACFRPLEISRGDAPE